MRVVVIKKNELLNFILPENINGNYSISDFDSDLEKRVLLNIDVTNNQYKINSSFEITEMHSEEKINNFELKKNTFYKIGNENEIIYFYVAEVYDSTYKKYLLPNNYKYLIGKGNNANIKYSLSSINNEHAVISFKDNTWYIDDLNSNLGVYVNNKRITSSSLEFGDIIFIFGLKIILLKDYILVNNINNLVECNLNPYSETTTFDALPDYDEEENAKIVNENKEYFHKSPRFKTISEIEEINIDAPPRKEERDKTPLAYIIGPMVTMAMVSLVTAIVAVNSMVNNQATLLNTLPTLTIALSMMMSMILWPSLTKKYEAKNQKRKEKERQEKYSKYIESKKDKLKLMIKLQAQVLKDNYISPKECSDIILEKNFSLWNRNIEDDDFLSLRLGLGNSPLDAKIHFKEEDFVMEEDNLKKMAESLVYENKLLEDVPISFNFADKYISGIVGNSKLIKPFIDSLILQMTTFYSYEQLKIIILTKEQKEWKYLKYLPHIFNTDKSVRFFASDFKEMKEISLYLEGIFQARKTNLNDSNKNIYKQYKEYYIIITDDYKNSRELEIVKDILDTKVNIGFSLIILNDKLSGLPNECDNFINIGDKTSGVFESNVTYTNQKEFTYDSMSDVQIEKCMEYLSNINLEILDEETNLPTTLGFLEMYDVGKIEQLNILNRWQSNNIISSLQAPIGLDINNNIITLDLHEKAHGPHGLIAGMTGSGKSELIITYILSMAINYHPNEVSFVLIDYKGGGLSGIFHNKETGFKLPHLAGSITNLEASDMNRALVSIQSELRRRQEIFNNAREQLGESTIDIYKYQAFYREGKVKEPVSHLFIIIDEFAELKQQQPDFMDQLISTSRIGRSLGVHLILATQKPTGVVNDQIWSNSRFRICLKVQEKNDSMEIIKSPLAAEIKNTGRFYLQVGYNEIFKIGQSAWTGKKYYPSDKVKKKIDTSINFIDNIGNVIKSVDDIKMIQNPDGEEVTKILKALVEIASEKQIVIPQLWHDKIESIIYLEDLIKKYSYNRDSYEINPIIGEYDDPFNQRQDLLTLNLSRDGNTIIYGSTGSGKELFLTTIIYSIISNYSPEEINIYILDFGTGILRNFAQAPQIGDIVNILDDENIDKLIKMLEKEITNRKNKLFNYGGDYLNYVKKSLDKIPLICLIINNYDNLAESYDEYYDRLSSVVREGNKYGIVAILTTTTPSSVRYKLKQSFQKEFILKLNDDFEYANIVGKSNIIIPDGVKGRGIVRLDDIYEYQVAHICEEDSEILNINNLINELNIKFTLKASKIPMLPEIVNLNYVLSNIDNLSNVPIGVEKDNLNIYKYNFSTKNITLILSQEITLVNNFINELIHVFNRINSTKLVIFDAENVIKNSEANLCISEQYDATIEELYHKRLDIQLNNNKLVCLIIGVDNLLNSIKSETREHLEQLFDSSSKIKFIFVDTVMKMKKVEFEQWYKDNVDTSSGIWIGNGIANQYSIVINKIIGEYRDEIAKNYGYVVVNGQPKLIKILESENNE